jgi:uncharacterized Zn-finger protein
MGLWSQEKSWLKSRIFFKWLTLITLVQIYLYSHNYCHHTEMECNICGLVLQGQNAMSRHKLNDHASLKDFLCQQCGQGFKARSYLRKHVLMSHTAPSERPFPCTLCPKGFYTSSKLKEHTNGVHDKVKPFACRDEVCTVAFASYNERKRHERRQHNLFIKMSGRGIRADSVITAEANPEPAENQ